MIEPVSDSDSSGDDDQTSDSEHRDHNISKLSSGEEYSNSSSPETDNLQALWKGNMSLTELMEVREKVGIKKFNTELYSNIKSGSKLQKSKQETKFYKRNKKHRPLEFSSKIKVPFMRQVVKKPKSSFMPRDPRFDNLCGSEFNQDKFDKSYSFLDDIRQREADQLREMLKKTDKQSEKQKLRYLIRRMKEQKKAKDHRSMMRQVEKEYMKKECEKVEKGIKKPYYLSLSKKKELIRQKKQALLNELGQADKAEAKKEKKLKSKERKTLPVRRILGQS